MKDHDIGPWYYRVESALGQPIKQATGPIRCQCDDAIHLAHIVKENNVEPPLDHVKRLALSRVLVRSNVRPAHVYDHHLVQRITNGWMRADTRLARWIGERLRTQRGEVTTIDGYHTVGGDKDFRTHLPKFHRLAP